MSLLAKLAIAVLRIQRGKKDLADKASLDAAIARRRPIDRHAPSKLFRRTYDVRAGDSHGHPCFRVARRGNHVTLKILYLHGGCYTYEITGYHWDFLGGLLDALAKAGVPAEITVPIYPLAPESDHAATFAMIEPLADELAAPDPTRFVIMGDSAGGGMALALAQLRARAKKAQPRVIVLLSPWLDIALTNPKIDDTLARRDPMLARGGLVAAGTYWRGALDPTSPIVSPLRGSLDDLAPIALLVGGREIFLPDARALRDRLVEKQLPVSYLEEPAMFHVWPLVTLLPEARRARDWIVRALR